jgi:hypothetical protein
MADNLDYIRKAIQKQGKFARVKVLRYEINRHTGMFENPKQIETQAALALDQFEKPFNKRIHNFKKMRPIGENINSSSNSFGLSNLESPELMNMIKEQAKAELESEIRAKLMAEMGQTSEEKPKRKKKSDVETYDLDSNDE